MEAKQIAHLSFDIETDGACVLKNSMLSVGIVLITENCEIINKLYIIYPQKRWLY